jgi:anti-sigma factor RsiW
MSEADCVTLQLLVQADLDGELAPADSARVAAHLEHCAACQALQADLMPLGLRLRREAPRFTAPAALRASIAAQIEKIAPAPSRESTAFRWPTWRRAGPFGAGFALAACLALLVLAPRNSTLSSEIVSDHIRALQPGHLMDVVSTDQHTVKPWFDGRLDFAPTVKDLKKAGFALTGGRLDYLAGKPVAALIYQRRQHVIDVFVWPDQDAPGASDIKSSHSGYHVVQWREGGMLYSAVSDLNPDELGEFERLWKAE